MTDPPVPPVEVDASADFRRLFESAPNLYLVVRPDWQIVAVSDAYLQATMTTRAQIVGQNAFDIFPDNPDDPQTRGASLILESWQRVLSSGQPDVMPLQKYDIRKPESEGGEFETRYWSVVNSPVLNGRGRVDFIIHRAEDVTDVVRDRQSFEEQEKRTAELTHRANLLELDVAMRMAELRKSYRDLYRANSELSAIRCDLERRIELRTADLQRRNQDLEQIAYAASHDLQEPLRAVGGYCQLLLMEYGPDLPSEAVDYLQKAVEGAQRMSAMVNGILEFARAPEESQTLQPTDANAAYLDALSSLDAAIEESGATVLRGELPVVTSDRILLGQLFQNLISNAIKYRSERPPVVMVNARKGDQEWVFTIADNGIGIPEDARERVFTIFKRLKSRQVIPGAGIGLALCRQIVERHGGRIWIEGEEAQGTKVCFTLPIPAEEPIIAGHI